MIAMICRVIGFDKNNFITLSCGEGRQVIVEVLGNEVPSIGESFNINKIRGLSDLGRKQIKSIDTGKVYNVFIQDLR